MINNGVGSILFVGPTTAPYMKAMEYCDNNAGVLATIVDSIQNNDSINACMANNPPSAGCWFGLNDRNMTDVYEFVDGTSVKGTLGIDMNGSPVDGFPWHGTEPNSNTEHCIGLWKDKGYEWNDFGCDSKLKPLCRALTNNPTAAPTLSPSLLTIGPTISPTVSPTNIPTRLPTNSPTITPSIAPSKSPSYMPTQSPIITDSPTAFPSILPTMLPSTTPTITPSTSPAVIDGPTVFPSISPTMLPSATPTKFDEISMPNSKSKTKRILIIALISLLSLLCIIAALVLYLLYKKFTHNSKNNQNSFPKGTAIHSITSVSSASIHGSSAIFGESNVNVNPSNSNTIVDNNNMDTNKVTPGEHGTNQITMGADDDVMLVNMYEVEMQNTDDTAKIAKQPSDNFLNGLKDVQAVNDVVNDDVIDEMNADMNGAYKTPL